MSYTKRTKFDPEPKLRSSRCKAKKESKRGINISVKCINSDCSNLGVFDGNFNNSTCGPTGQTGFTGNTGFTGFTGQTGFTGNTGTIISDYEQVYLQQFINPSSFTELGQEYTLSFIVTNIRGTAISGPLVVVSSALGTLYLTEIGLGAGETLTVSIAGFVTT